MPVLISQNIAVSHDTKDSFRRMQSRRQSRLTVYLTTVNESQEEDVSIFNETCVQNALEEQQERRKLQRFEKLKLVWKGDYKPEKTPQDSLTELIAHRNAPKHKLRLNAFHQKRSILGKTVERHRTFSHLTHATHSSYITDSGICKSDILEQASHMSGHQLPSQKGPVRNESHVFGQVGSDHEILTGSGGTGKLEEDTSSVLPQNYLSIHRYSRSIFNTKKATGHLEHNLFLYRTEKKKPIIKEAGTEEKKRKSTDSLLDALKVFQQEREKRVPELKTKVDVDTILRAYLSEQFLELNLEGPEALEMRRLYKSAIMNQPTVNNLIMKHPDMLSSRIFKDLVTFKKGFEVNPMYSTTIVKSNEGPWRQLCHKAFSSPSGSVLIELETDSPLYANFYKSLLQKRAETIRVEESWLRDRKPNVIRDNLLHLTVNLRISRQNPGSTIRFDMLRIFAAAGRNDRLLRQLGLSVEGWLDQLVKGLFSPFKSVRDETCQVLCLMTSTYPVMRELYLSKYFDVIQDLSIAVFRAIDQHEDTFPEYYILLAHIIHYCPSRSIIECIIERWTHFRCVGLILRWPRLLYYALRYWPDELMYVGNRLFGARVSKALDIALQRPFTAKVCRHALYYLQVRFNAISRLFTINFSKETPQSSLLAALHH